MKTLKKGQLDRIIPKIISTILIASSLFISSPTAIADEDGFKLPNLLGQYGEITGPIETLFMDILEVSGLDDAATAAATAMTDLATGQVPVISGLQDPFRGNVEDTIEASLNNAKIAFDIMNNVTGPAAEIALKAVVDSVLFAEADFGITLPFGRIRVVRNGLEASICLTIVGPFGSRITTGISNSAQLCGNPAPRMSNSIEALTLFSDLAIGYSHVQSRRILAPNLNTPFIIVPPPSLVAETYVKINGQWVKIKLAGSDPESIEMGAEFEVGLKAGFRAELMAEIGGTVVLGIKVKPTHAMEIIQGTSDVMVTLAQQQLIKAIIEVTPISQGGEGLARPTDDVLANAGAVIKAGLDHLQTFSDDPEYEGELGEATLVIGGSVSVGIGIWDTGIAGVSAGVDLSTSLPLEVLVQSSAAFFGQLLESGLNLTVPTQDFFIGLLKGTLTVTEEATFLAETKTAANELLSGALTELVDLAPELKMKLGFKVVGLGETSKTQKNSIPLMGASIKFPVGDFVDNLVTNPNPIGDSLEAAAYLTLSAIKPDIVIDWDALTYGVASRVEYSLMSMGPAPLINIGFSEVFLLDYLEMMELQLDYVQPILVGVIQSGLTGDIDPMRTAFENAIDNLGTHTDETYLRLVKSPRLNFGAGFGANFELGAEAVLSLGFGAQLEGEIKASLLLLLTGRDEYEEEGGTVLASVALPVSFNAALGASLGEGVEFEIKGGGSIGMNLFELSLVDWDGALPPPAGMTVNGFEVIEFHGEIRNDESFTGTGFLALPMGGIVEASFDVDAYGILQPGGQWWGGFDLGPLGKLTLATGPFTIAGIEGIVTLPFFDADFTLTSTGWVYGTFNGDVTIAGLQLSGFHLTLEGNGFFDGNGFIDLGGFTTDVNASWTEYGFTGEGHMNLLGSTLNATNLTITNAGATGTFTGDLVLFGHTLSAVSLELIDGGLGLMGTAKMDFFGVAGVDMTLHVSNGILTATSASKLSVFGTLAQTSSSKLTFSKDGVRVYAVMDDDLLGTINEQVTNAINVAAMDAQILLSAALDGVELAQAEVDKLNNDIAAMRVTVTNERQKAVDDAKIVLDAADTALGIAVAIFNSAHNELSKGITKAQADLNAAQYALDGAKKEVNKLNNDITNLDNWWNGLNGVDQFFARVGYLAARLTLIGLRDTANLGLDIAKAFLAGVERDLGNAWTLYNIAIQPKKLAMKAKEDARAVALLGLNIAKLALNNPDTDIRVIGLITLRNVANIALSGTWGSLHTLQNLVGGAAQIATYINDVGLALLFRVDHASFEADYQGLGPHSFVNMTANLLHMGKEREVTFAFNFGNPVGSFQTMANSLQPVMATTDDGLTPDTTAPLAEATAPVDWQKNAVTVTINATDNVGGSGVESITYSTSGAQAISPVTVSGSTTHVQVNIDGTTTLTYFATDKSNNIGLTKTITVKVDQTAPTIGIDVPTSGLIIPRDVTITATDNASGSGVNYITLSTSGAETHSTMDFPGSTAIINLSVTGQTALTVVVLDKAGNSSTITRILTVEDTEPPVVIPPGDIVNFEATGVLTSVFNGIATATDNVEVVSITSNAPANFPVGTTTVVWSATDAAGNQGTAIQNITVVDSTPPDVTGPANILDYEATAINSVLEIGAATATDLVGVVSIVNDAPVAFLLGTTIVTWTATDTAGNRTIAMQYVNVVDTTAPELTVPADIVVTATDLYTTVDIGEATATDLVGVSEGPIASSFGPFEAGTTTITWTTIDASGNIATATQKIVVLLSMACEVKLDDSDKHENKHKNKNKNKQNLILASNNADENQSVLWNSLFSAEVGQSKKLTLQRDTSFNWSAGKVSINGEIPISIKNKKRDSISYQKIHVKLSKKDAKQTSLTFSGGVKPILLKGGNYQLKINKLGRVSVIINGEKVTGFIQKLSVKLDKHSNLTNPLIKEFKLEFESQSNLQEIKNGTVSSIIIDVPQTEILVYSQTMFSEKNSRKPKQYNGTVAAEMKNKDSDGINPLSLDINNSLLRERVGACTVNIPNHYQ